MFYGHPPDLSRLGKALWFLIAFRKFKDSLQISVAANKFFIAFECCPK